MTKQVNNGAARGPFVSLQDRDWLTIIGALLSDAHPESRELGRRLMTRSKHGRQMRLLRLMRDKKPRLREMAAALKVSRRTVFRYLNDLEIYGVRVLVDGSRYRVDRVPDCLLRLL